MTVIMVAPGENDEWREPSAAVDGGIRAFLRYCPDMDAVQIGRPGMGTGSLDLHKQLVWLRPAGVVTHTP
jgi:hypothetical protein